VVRITDDLLGDLANAGLMLCVLGYFGWRFRRWLRS
jgi:hypothetical protein